MEYPKQIKLNSRDLQENYLEHTENDVYEMKAQLNHVRYGYTDDQQGLCFVDPPGGPFIAVGDSLQQYTNDKLPNDLTVYKIDLKGNIYVK